MSQAPAACPCCGLQWDEPGCEQAASIDLFGECIPCRFLPAGKGSRSGTLADMDRIVARRKEMLAAMARVAETARAVGPQMLALAQGSAGVNPSDAPGLMRRLLAALEEFDKGARNHGMTWQRSFIVELRQVAPGVGACAVQPISPPDANGSATKEKQG